MDYNDTSPVSSMRNNFNCSDKIREKYQFDLRYELLENV